MTQLLRTIFVFLGLFVLLNAGVILIGQQRQEPLKLFDSLKPCNNGGMCYLGIMSGGTTSDEMYAAFENMPEIKFDPDTNIASNPPGFDGSVIVRDASDRARTLVAWIELHVRSSDIDVGSMVMQFGTPCAVDLHAIPNTEFLIFTSGIWVLVSTGNLDAGILRPTTPVREIELFFDTHACDELPLNAEVQPWKGFARYTN